MLETNTCQITTPKVLFWSIHKKKNTKAWDLQGKVLGNSSSLY